MSGAMPGSRAAGGRNARPKALAETGHGSNGDSDTGTASEDGAPDTRTHHPDYDAESVVGVSIGHVQSRLTSPQTPAAEKAAAVKGAEREGFFSKWFPARDEAEDEDDGQVKVRSGAPLSVGTFTEASSEVSQPGEGQGLEAAKGGKSQLSTEEALPSPWHSGPKHLRQVEDVKPSHWDNLSAHTSQKLSDRPGIASEGLRRLLPFSLPSLLPKNVSIRHQSVSPRPEHGNDKQRPEETEKGSRTSAFLAGWNTHRDASMRTRSLSESSNAVSPRRSTVQGDSPPAPISETEPSPYMSTAKGGSDMNQVYQQSGTITPPESRRRLYRSASDDSQLLHSTLSRASSFGDDSRFEHVQGKVNSRFKAIKDCLQDANIMFPGRSAMPSFTFSSLRLDSSFPKPINVGSKDLGSAGDKAPNGSPTSNGRVHAHRRTASNHSASNTAGTTPTNAAAHPYFTRALEDLTGDVVVLGAYRGSILRSAEPPHRRLWVPIKVGLNLRKVDLEVGLDPEDEETMEERIIPGGMLTHVGPVDMSRRLLKRMKASDNARSSKLRVHNYGYDWRLSPHLLSRKLIGFLEGLECNAPGTPVEERGAIVIAHSLGGLITRHAINQRPELVAGVVYAGVPHTCVNILGPLRNGDDVLLSSRVLTAQVNFTIRTSFALLPLDGRCFFDKHTKEEYPVDFFNVNDWIEHRWSPCIAPPLPPLTAPPSNGPISGLLGAIASVVPNLPLINRKSSLSKHSTSPSGKAHASSGAKTAAEGGASNSGIAPQMHGHGNPAEHGQPPNTSVSTAVTMAREAAVAYLARTLADVKRFKQELAFEPGHARANAYPPAAVIYGKSTPTVYGARVDGREGIGRADAYDELAFASGDGVVLARAAMLPEGYRVVRGGVVSSDRGHVTLLSDLEAVGRALTAVVVGRRGGIRVGVGVGRGEGGGG